MCGIAGVLDGPERIAAMTKGLHHRGPDAQRWMRLGRCSMGVSRLAIRPSGSQPVRAGNLLIAFNGELYNTANELAAIAKAYYTHGDSFPSALDGMFAIALWDEDKQKLLLCRDRYGIKPLYLRWRGATIDSFASEQKALLRPGDLIDETSLSQYTSFKHIDHTRPVYYSISEVYPGSVVIASKKGLVSKEYYALPAREERVDENVAAKSVRYLLEESVRKHLVSDVPLGVFLSGGLDSSAVTALARASLGPNAPIHTFTLTHKPSDVEAAREVSTLFNTIHHEIEVSPAEIEETLPHISRAFDEPFSGVVSTYFVARAARAAGIYCILTGDGADELFGSYRAVREGAADVDERMEYYLQDTKEARKVINRWYRECPLEHPVNRALWVDWHTLLPDQVLKFVDRLSMAHGVEVRPPFLDRRLVEYVWTLSADLKIKNGRVKHILKEALKDILPEHLINRPKDGFVSPWQEFSGQEFNKKMLTIWRSHYDNSSRTTT